MVGGVLGGGFLMLLLVGALAVGAFIAFLRYAWHS
jgi:hypothetical protein